MSSGFEMSEEEIEAVLNKKEETAKKNPSVSFPVRCPICSCDYILPLMQIVFNKSFAGNVLTSVWPSREGSNNWAVVACPECGEIYKIETDGTIRDLNKKLALQNNNVPSNQNNK